MPITKDVERVAIFAKKDIAQLETHLQNVRTTGLKDIAETRKLPYRMEPMTSFTDGILALLTIFLAGILCSRAAGRRTVRLWVWGFVAMTVVAFAGVMYHGMRVAYALTTIDRFWRVVPISTGLAMFFFGCAGAAAWLQGGAKRVTYAALAVVFVVAAILAWKVDTTDFKVTLLGAGPALVFLLIASLLHWREPAARWIFWGLIVSIVALGVQASEALNASSFDHNDLFHIIQMAAMYLLYRGGALLTDREPSAVHVPSELAHAGG